MDVKRWSRIDQLFFEGLLYAVPGLVLVLVAARVVRAWHGDPLEVTGPLPASVAAPPEGVTGPLSGTVVLSTPSTGDHVVALLPGLLGLVLAVTAAWLLLGIARGLRAGDPFTRANARRLSSLAVLVVVGGLLMTTTQAISTEALMAAALPGAEDRPSVYEVSLWPFPVAMFVFFLAEVFARGARLREDVEGLV